MNNAPEIQSAHAILLVSGRYALQWRDDKPTISAPGTWSLFGGMIQQGETPSQAIQREIAEELCIEPGAFQPFGFQDYFSDFEKVVIRTWLFVSDVTLVWPDHILTEGQGAAVYAFQELAGLSIPPVMRQVLTQFHHEKNVKQCPDGKHALTDEVPLTDVKFEGINC
jgi:8-oxo-dGTP diphosphatase